ncbi:MAG: amino acid ABC transporter permease [Granulosicoccus sp.]
MAFENQYPNGGVVNAGDLPDKPAPIRTDGLIAWMRDNLFNGMFNSMLSLVALALIIYTVPPALNWLIFNASWVGGADACRANPDGACWPFVTSRWEQFLYGFYEKSERWRIDILLAILAVGIVLMVWENAPGRRLVAVFMLFVYPLLAFFMMYGIVAINMMWIAGPLIVLGLLLLIFTGGYLRIFSALLFVAGSALAYKVIDGTVQSIYPLGEYALPIVDTPQWGGFTLTLVIALSGIVASLPLGVVLALGRRSKMPIISLFCTIFIEFWRGIPLVAVLFMATIMFPLFLPEGVTFDQLLRAVIGVALFASAYMAEVVRGGLQAIPKGQYEGAMALGLPYSKMMRLIVLPQALKVVIPGIVNTFIGLFKDTTLVLIIALFDLLGIVQASIADPNWSIKSVPYTGYAFVGIVFWMCCYSMARYSRYIEAKLHTGHKR